MATAASAGSETANGAASRIGITRARLYDWLAGQSLARQFIAVGAIVSFTALLVVGIAVTALIERAVTRNAGATTALYVDSVIAPLLPDMKTGLVLDDAVRRALDETLGQGALGQRLAAMRLWGRDGTILYSNEEKLVGRQFERSDSLIKAFAGEMVVNYDRFDVLDGHAPPGPLLEIYNPILQPWSGEVVAVIEFYEHAEEFAETLRQTRIRSWLAIAGVILTFFLALSAIVLRGSRTIDRQSYHLARQVRELTQLLDQNRALNLRVQSAAERVTALNETYLRRIGADLHDGPAQLIALASLKLDSNAVLGQGVDARAREQEVAAIRRSLDEALQEIRSISHGLVLPHIEDAALADLVEHAIEAYERRSGANVARQLDNVPVPLPVPERICIYRFLQEALNNGHRHCPGAPQRVTLTLTDDLLSVTVADEGQGFDPNCVSPGSIGLAGLRDRVESLGADLQLDTSARGTTVTVMLNLASEGRQ